MPTTTLLKPGTAGTAILTPGADQLMGATTGLTEQQFIIKLQRLTIRYAAPLVETSGDTDTDPTWENGEWIYAEINAAGFMMSTGINILALVLQDSVGGSDGPWAFTVLMASGIDTTITGIIERIRVGWDRRGPLIPLQFSIRSTDAEVGQIDAI